MRAICPSDVLIVDFVEGVLTPGEHRRIAEHVAVCTRCDELVLQALRTLHEGDTIPSVQLPAPRRAGRYELDEILGVGAMGIVYLAYDPQLGRRVAIKILRAFDGGSSDGTEARDRREARQRFVRESRSMARVVHPNVVTIYDVGEIDDGVFVAMELAEAGTLRSWLESEPRSVDAILAMFQEIALGLNAIHRAGLVHRDFKPENVLVGRDGRPRVSDFGLARDALLAPEPVQRPARSLTQSQTVALVGTPAYLPPEGLRGEGTDARSDLFSFAVTLWEALAGTRPFAGASADDLIRNIEARRFVDGDLPKARQRGRLLAVLHKALAASPSARYRSMEELIAALRTIDATSQRRRASASLGAALGLACLASFWGANRAIDERRCDPSRLVDPWQPATAAAIRAQFASVGAPEVGVHVAQLLAHYAEDLASAARDSCTATYRQRTQSEATYALQTECLHRLGNRFSLLATSLEKGEVRALRAAGIAGALEVPAVCASLTARGSVSAADPHRRRALVEALDRGFHQLELGQYSDASAAFRSLLDEAELVGDRTLVAEALLGLGQSDEGLGQLPLAQRRFETALAIGLLERAPKMVFRAHALIATVQSERGGSASELARTLATYDWFATQTGVRHQAEARILSNLAWALLGAGKGKEAEAIALRALRLPGLHINRLSEIEHAYGTILMNVGRAAEGELFIHRAILDATAAYGADSHVVLSFEKGLAFAEYSLYGAQAAVPVQRRVVDRITRLASENTVQVVSALQNLAAYLGMAKQDAEGLVVARRAVDAAQKLPPDSLARLGAESTLAAKLVDVGELDDALTLLDRIRPYLDPVDGSRPPEAEAISLHLAYAQALATRNRDQARGHLVRLRQLAAPYATRADVQAVLKDAEAVEKKLGGRPR